MKNRMMVVVSALSIFAGSASLSAFAEETPEFHQYSGVVGSSPINITIGFLNGKIVDGSHYYYRKYLKDIPLMGTVGSEIRLNETGGGIFMVHSVDNHNKPVTEEKSIGMIGTWSGNGHVLPVKLSAENIQSYVAGHRYASITSKSDVQFEACVRGFYDAVLAGKPDAAAHFVAFPLRVNISPGKYMLIHDAIALKQKWKYVFSAQWLKDLARSSPHDLFITEEKAMMGNGLAFFNDKGLDVVNVM